MEGMELCRYAFLNTNQIVSEPFIAAAQGPRANGESRRGALYVFRGVVGVVLRPPTIPEGAGTVVLAEGKARGKRQKRHVRVTHTRCIESHQTLCSVLEHQFYDVRFEPSSA